MKCFTRLIKTLGVLALFCLIFTKKAYAYIDPGTGSYILQIIMAALLGGLFTVKLYWKKIRIFFKNLFSRREKREKHKE